MKNPFERLALLAPVLLLALLASPAPAADALPSPLALSYTVEARGRDMGHIQVQLERGADSHRLEALTRPDGVAKLFADDIVERFAYLPGEGGWQSRAYEEKGGDEDDHVQLDFAYGDRLTISGNVEGGEFPADSLVEPQGFPLAPLLLADDALASREILMPSKRGLRSYRYRKQGTETLAIGDRRFAATKWLKQRPDRTDRGFHIWVDDGTRLPLRIEKFKDDEIVIIRLSEDSAATLR